jgi:hypothetical protein
MALIARIKHPYIVEFKEAWVEKVRNFLKYSYFCFNNLLRRRYCCGEETSRKQNILIAPYHGIFFLKTKHFFCGVFGM